MNLRARMAAAWAVITNRYESGQRYDAARSDVPGFVRDARFDADQATRLEIVRKARYFERNSGIVNRLADLFEQFTVGANGLQFVPASSDEEWNTRARDWWTGWERVCDIASLHPFGSLQSLCARLWFVDGEVFLLKTWGDEVLTDGRTIRRPRVQLIESHRVATPTGLAKGVVVIDGIELNSKGRPVAYHVRTAFEGDKFERIEAPNIIHIFEPSRAGQYRGLPMLYPVLNDLHDLDDLQMLQMRKSKDAADITNVFKTKTGELPANGLEAQRFTINRQTNANVETLETRTDYIRKASGGGRTIAIRTDETLDQHRSDTPSIADQAHWDYVLSKICAGVGISKLLVMPFSLQGTVTRADLDTAAVFFRSRSAVLASAFEIIYRWCMEWAVYANANNLGDPPADFLRVTVRPPRSVNVDVGRNSSALIAEYEAGWRTLEAICGEMGEDWRQVLRQRAKERRTASEIEAEFTLPEGSLIGAALEAIKQQDASRAPKPEAVTV